MFSSVAPQPIPPMTPRDWAIISAGLAVGIGLGFEILYASAKSIKISRSKVYTPKIFWLIMSGVIHCWIEFNFTFMRSTSSIKTALDMYAAAVTILSYSTFMNIDYRYGDYGGYMESGTTAMEAITALIVGPLCFLVAVATVHNWPSLHVFQIILCTMQLYGLIWFTLQPMFTSTGITGHFSSDPILFWGIAVGMNAPWSIFPSILLMQSYFVIVNTFKDVTKKSS